MKIMDRMIKKENIFVINYFLLDKQVIKILFFMYFFKVEFLFRNYFFLVLKYILKIIYLSMFMICVKNNF